MATSQNMAEYKSFTYDYIDPDGEDYHLGCKCCRFNKGVDLPVPRSLSPEEIEKAARELSTQIFKDWTRLNAVIKRFEGTIQKRWMKKNHKQRRELLLKIRPGMPTTHRPDFEHFRTSKQAPRSRTCRSAAFIWPYINLEDLQQRNLLLLFLNSRGRNLPDVFRIADIKAAHLGTGWCRDVDFGDITEHPEHYCDQHAHASQKDCMMLFHAKHSLLGYGKVIDRDRKGVEASQFKCLSGSPEGLLALEIQKEIYDFLLSCTKLILHDINPRDMFLAPHQPEPAMPANPPQWASLTGHVLESSYRTPQKMDLERLKQLSGASRSSAEDHIWFLREDPAYFMENIREWMEHHGKPGNDGKPCWCKGCYQSEAGRMICNGYIMFAFWDDIHRKLCAMEPIDVQLGRADEHKVRLKPIDENRWAALIEIIELMIVLPIALLKSGLPTSPRLRGSYTRWSPPGNELEQQWVLKKKANQSVRRVDRLFDSVFNEDQVELHSMRGLLQEIEYMLETDSEANQYIDSWCSAHFEDLALLSELTSSIDALAPWFDKFKASGLLKRTSVQRQLNRVRSIVRKLDSSITEASRHRFWDLTVKSDFDYPIDKRPSKANTDQMMTAEMNLDMFWWTLEDEVYELEHIKLDRVLSTRMYQPRELHRTRPWKEPVQLPTPDTSPEKPSFDNEVPGQLHDTPTKVDRTPKNREKVKTRGTAAAPDPRTQAYQDGTPVAPVEEKEKEKIKIPKKASKVFCQLLPGTNAVVQQRGEMAWEELVAAFDAIGLEPEKLYGSVWIFKPVPEGHEKWRVQLDRSIQFHEPKEVRRGQKIPRPMVRTFGRRLTHAFGWTDGEAMFESE